MESTTAKRISTGHQNPTKSHRVEVTFPDGSTVTLNGKTAATKDYLVVIQHEEGSYWHNEGHTFGVIAQCGRLDLAAKKADEWEGWGHARPEIITVEEA